jgi:hypothetical protein
MSQPCTHNMLYDVTRVAKARAVCFEDVDKPNGLPVFLPSRVEQTMEAGSTLRRFVHVLSLVMACAAFVVAQSAFHPPQDFVFTSANLTTSPAAHR